jgi:hypothetical protein
LLQRLDVIGIFMILIYALYQKNTIVGVYKPEAARMIDHIERAKLHWKNICFIVSSCEQKTHGLLPCQFRLIRLSLVRITPQRKYYANFYFSVVFSSSRSSYYHRQI